MALFSEDFINKISDINIKRIDVILTPVNKKNEMEVDVCPIELSPGLRKVLLFLNEHSPKEQSDLL